MSKKSQLKRKQQRKVKKSQPQQTTRIVTSVPQRKMVSLDAILERIYNKEDLSTVCLRQCGCCRVACPQMKFAEASCLLDHIWATWPKPELKKLLTTCVRYFFSDSLLKPCPILNGKVCREYTHRPLNCRLYGLWPNDSWEERVAMFSKNTELPREKLPLNTQCQNVRRKPQQCKYCMGGGKIHLADPDGLKTMGLPADSMTDCPKCNGKGKFQPPPLTSEQIAALFESLDKADMFLGTSDLKVSTNWNYRTLHDWVLLKFYGEDVLVKWTNILLTTDAKQRQGLMEAFEAQADKLKLKA